jgi:hypothetical protein
MHAPVSIQYASSASGHERRFRDVRDESGLPPTPERLRQRSEPTLRATIRPSSAVVRGSIVGLLLPSGADVVALA